MATNQYEFKIKQYEILMELYKNHHDLYIKTVTLYYTIIGVYSGYIYSSEIANGEKTALLVLAAFASFIAFFGSLIYMVWAFHMKKSVKSIEDHLHFVNYSFFATIGSSILFMAASIGKAAILLSYALL